MLTSAKLAVALLFDRFRLVQLDDSRAPGEDEVSFVIAEVTRLLNVRAPLNAMEASGRSRRTVVDYGLVDFLHLSPMGRQDAQKLAAYVFAAVEAYVPQLTLEKVVVETPRPTRDALCAVLTGHVRGNGRLEVPLSFSVKVAASISPRWLLS